MAYASSVFRSPSYWIALAAGVVGIGAAALQERKGSGSAARVHRGSGVAYNVYLRGKLIDTVFQSGVSTVDEVKRSLIDHDGYDPAIRVTKAARSSGSGSMARSSKLTQKRLDADEAMFDRRFGGLVSNENGDNIQLSFNDPDDLQHYLDNHTLWTHVDGDAGTYLLPGLHRVNRIDYYISVRPWTDADLNTVEIAWTK